MNYLNRYVLGVMVSLGLVILIFIFASSSPTKKMNSKPYLVTDFAKTASSVEWDLYGPITAPTTHNEVKVVVSAQSTNVTVYQGYNGDVVATKNYNNTQNSYADFLQALNKSGFNLGDKNTKYSNPTGFCAFGTVYNYIINSDGKQIQNYWSSNCGGVRTYKGNAGQTNDLFMAQVPDFQTLIENTNVSTY